MVSYADTCLAWKRCCHDLVNRNLVDHNLVKSDLVSHNLVDRNLMGCDLVQHDLVDRDLNRDLVNSDKMNRD